MIDPNTPNRVAEEYEARIKALREAYDADVLALMYALLASKNSLKAAHECVLNEFYDEALLHTGCGEAAADKALAPFLINYRMLYGK